MDNFIKAILCDTAEDACESCTSCNKINHGNHEDILYIAPEGTSIKDEVIEEMQRMLKRKPLSAPRNIIVIEDAHLLTRRAQNRLLKTLEEPVGGAIIVLTVNNANSLAETIRSRCILLKLRPLRTEEVEMYLKAKYPNLAPEDTHMIAALSYGLVGKADRFAGSEEWQQFFQAAVHLGKQILERKPLYAVMASIERIVDKSNVIDFLDLTASWIRDALMRNYHLQPASSGMESSGKKQEVTQMIQAIYAIEQAKNDIKMNINYSYALKNMLVSIQRSA